MVFDAYEIEQMFFRDVIANKCTGTEILFLHDFMVVEQCADRRELIILCLEHEFEILNVQGIAFLPDFGNGILNRDLQIFDIPIDFFIIGGFPERLLRNRRP